MKYRLLLSLATSFLFAAVANANDCRDGEFQTYTLPLPNIAEVLATAIGDINGDNNSDIVISQKDTLTLMLRSDFGQITQTYNFPRQNCERLLLKDLDLDGSKEIICKGANTLEYAKLDNTNTRPKFHSLASGITGRTRFEDIDDDGDLDIAFIQKATSSFGKTTFFPTFFENLATETGELDFSPYRYDRIDNLAEDVRPHAADFDNDGVPEFVTPYGANSIKIASLTRGSLRLWNVCDQDVGESAYDSIISDPDADGDLDIILLTRSTDKLNDYHLFNIDYCLVLDPLSENPEVRHFSNLMSLHTPEPNVQISNIEQKILFETLDIDGNGREEAALFIPGFQQIRFFFDMSYLNWQYDSPYFAAINLERNKDYSTSGISWGDLNKDGTLDFVYARRNRKNPHLHLLKPLR